MATSHLRAVILILLCFHLLVSAIPFTLTMPAGFMLDDRFMYRGIPSRISLYHADPEVRDGTALCAKFHKDWWNGYKPRRALRRRTARPGNQFEMQYTDYSPEHLPEVPVEAIMAEIFPPNVYDTAEIGALWGCSVICQDLRKTWEWVLSGQLERKQHVRARFEFAFRCEKGWVPRLLRQQSRREQETEHDVLAALLYFSKLSVKLQLYKNPNYPKVVDGETGTITDCECYQPTPSELATLEQQYGVSKAVSNQGASTSGKALHARDDEARPYPEKRQRVSRRTCPVNLTRAPAHPSGTTAEPSIPTIDLSEDDDADDPVALLDDIIWLDDDHDVVEVEEEVEEFQVPDQLPDIGATCYDFDFPEIDVGSSDAIDLAARAREEAEWQVHEATGLLQAALHTVAAGFDAWCPSSFNPGAPHHPKHGEPGLR